MQADQSCKSTVFSIPRGDNWRKYCKSASFSPNCLLSKPQRRYFLHICRISYAASQCQSNYCIIAALADLAACNRRCQAGRGKTVSDGKTRTYLGIHKMEMRGVATERHDKAQREDTNPSTQSGSRAAEAAAVLHLPQTAASQNIPNRRQGAHSYAAFCSLWRRPFRSSV